MLTAIAIMGILAGISIGFLSQPQRIAIEDTTNRQNAAMFASTATCAAVAGADVVLAGDTVETAVRRIMRGVTSTKGILKDRKFVVSGIPEERLPGALYYLAIENGALVYRADLPMPTR